MGIKGLTSFINSQSNKFLKEFELHDTMLIIDGNSIMIQLYLSNKCNCCFGGDYIEYGYYVNEFFEELQMCRVTPIVMFDGALEDKKMKTVYDRRKQRIQAISVSTVANEQEIFPFLLKYAFIYIARQRNVKILVSTLEADNHIASLARILNCPVLSLDSDFYIFDVMYIPFTTLKIGYTRKSNNFMKMCKLFDRNNFLQEYNVDKKCLPLAAAILGNDYINSTVFYNFFQSLIVPQNIIENYSTKKLFFPIAVILNWLQKHTLDSAFAEIINKLDSDKQEVVLDILEMIINGYFNPLPKMLYSLEYSQEEINLMMQNIKIDMFTFDRTSNLDKRQRKNIHGNYFDYVESETESLSSNDYNIVQPEVEDALEKLTPSWFLFEYHKASFPSYFLDIVNRQHILITTQMEDFSKPTVFQVSLKIISVIYRLLSKGTNNTNILKYTARSGNNDVTTFELDCEKYMINFEIPELEKLKDHPISARKIIFLNTMGISEESLLVFPPEWRLLIATIKYWHSSADSVFTTNYHLYTLILLIVYNVARKITGDKLYFKCKEQAFSDIEINKSVKDALDGVKEDDCLWALRFFKSKNNIDKNQFDISVVHGFAIFQNCLRYSMDLNALLGCPYQRINIAEFISSTLMYNIYNELKGHQKLNGHICDIFQKSPSILQLFVAVSTKIKNLL